MTKLQERKDAAFADAPDLYASGTEYAVVILGLDREPMTRPVVLDGDAVDQLLDQWTHGRTLILPEVDNIGRALVGQWRHLRCDLISEIRTGPESLRNVM